MAAFSLEAGNKVWQKVKIATAGANPATQNAFAELKKYLAQQKANPDLQFLAFDGSSSSGPIHANGQLLATGVATVYGVWAKKPATGVDVFLWVIDDVDDDSTLSTKGNIMLSFLDSSGDVAYINPTGNIFGTGLVVKAYTTPLGTTDTTSVADCPSGFVIVGA